MSFPTQHHLGNVLAASLAQTCHCASPAEISGHRTSNGSKTVAICAAGEGAARPGGGAADYGTEEDSDEATDETALPLAARPAPAGEPARKRRKAPSAVGSP